MSAVLEAQEPSARYLEAVQPALVRQFELLATAPGAVTQLRELILALAVQGKLVCQDARDEPASGLLERIAGERTRLIAAGKLRKSKDSTEDDALEPPYSLPQGWAWSKLAVIGVINPRNDAADDVVTSFVQMSSIPVAFNDQHTTEARPWRDIKSGFTQFAEGDVGVAKITPCFENGKSTVFQNLSNGIGAGTTELHIVRPLCGVAPRYLLLFLKSPGFLREGEATMTGTAGQKRLPRSFFENCPFPLPPLAEQARIVTRVEELMRLCDALEAKGRLEAEQHACLLGTLLGKLTDSSTPEELAANWQRVADHLDLLLNRPEAVDALEQAILQLGLRGVLLPSPSLDECPTANGQQRSSQDDPFAWPTAKFGDVLKDLRYGTSAKCSYAQSGTPVLRIPNLRDGAIDTSDLKFGELEPKEADNLRLEVGDLLIIRSNGSAGLVGTAALVSSPLPGFAFAGYLVRARLDRAKVVPHFMALVMRSPEVRRQIEGPIRTTSGVKNINSTEIQRISFTLPPLEVQELIVHTVTELRRLCADLHERLDRCNTVRAALADALIDQALLVA